MELTLETYNPNLLIKSIAKAFNTTADASYVEEKLHIPKKYGDGRIIGFNFSDGVGLLLFDCIFNEKLTLTFDKSLLSPLLFNFVSEGNFSHVSNHENNHFTLSSLQGAISANPISSSESFIFQALEPVVFSCILVNRKDFKHRIDAGMEKMPAKVRSVFFDTATENPFFFQTNYTMTSSIHLQSIKNNEHDDLAGSIYLEGITLELLSTLVRDFKNSISNFSAKRTILNKEDIAKVLAAKEILLENLQESPSIELLSKLIGINQTKLKIGFKNIFNSPIKTWLRHERLKSAQLLILKDQKSIKEIAEIIGYINHSHFARQFKSRYGVLPKNYLKLIKEARTFTQ